MKIMPTQEAHDQGMKLIRGLFERKIDLMGSKIIVIYFEKMVCPGVLGFRVEFTLNDLPYAGTASVENGVVTFHAENAAIIAFVE